MQDKVTYANIDWRQLSRHSFVRRYQAHLMLAVAGDMLCGAALLWKGDHGAGRLAARRITDLAVDLYRLARSGRSEAYLKLESEIINGLPEEMAGLAKQPIGSLLFEYAEKFAFRPDAEAARTGILAKNPAAARRQAVMAVQLIETSIHLLRSTYPDGQVALANRLEDTLEQLCTEDVLEKPFGSPGDGYVKCMIEYALQRECQTLCTSMSRLYLFADELTSAKAPHAPQSRAWTKASGWFAGLANERHVWFASLQGKASTFELSSMQAVRNENFGGAVSSSRHYRDDDALRLCAEMAAGLITVLQNVIFPQEGAWQPPEPQKE